MAVQDSRSGGPWFVAYTIKDGEAGVDHWSPVSDEAAARERFAELVGQAGVYCACIGPIADATEPHWLVEGAI